MQKPSDLNGPLLDSVSAKEEEEAAAERSNFVTRIDVGGSLGSGAESPMRASFDVEGKAAKG